MTNLGQFYMDINRVYEFLLDDRTRDPDYTEGREVGRFLVYGTSSEMWNRFSTAFEKSPIPLEASLFGISPVWHVKGCTIRYNSKKDKELPNKPHCFGFLSVVGTQENVEIVNTILISSFPRIDDLVNDHAY
jgi:hypothetical protein